MQVEVVATAGNEYAVRVIDIKTSDTVYIGAANINMDGVFTGSGIVDHAVAFGGAGDVDVMVGTEA